MRISKADLKNVCTHPITKKTQIRFSPTGTQGAELRPNKNKKTKTIDYVS